MAIGQAGRITQSSPVANQPITVNLAEALTNPVFALSATNTDGEPFVLRITDQTLDTNGDTTAFTFIIEEWEYLDGAHGTPETVNWLAIEEGIHTLADGRIIEAGTSSISSTTRNTGGNVSFGAEFTNRPVVLTSVMSENDTTTVDSDPSNITKDGFDLTLQEEEEQDGAHAAETIGWIAIQAGGDATTGTANTHRRVNQNVDVLELGDTFTSSVVLAETQTLDGTDTATVVIDSQSNTQVGVFIDEEQSSDPEVNHVNETVGIVAFEDGLIPCFTRGTWIEVLTGMQNIERLSVGDVVRTKDNSLQTIRWLGRRKLDADQLNFNPKLRPVRITAGALGMGLPKRDLLVSRQHRMLLKSEIARQMFGRFEVLLPAIKLTELPGIFVDLMINSVEYFHLLFDQHEVIYAEGAPTESLFTGPEALKSISPAARQEIRTIFPDVENLDYTPQPVRLIPTGRSQKQLVSKHLQQNKPCISPENTYA